MIDKMAIVDPKARLGKNVTIGPWTYIGPDVEIGDNTWIASHVVIKGPTTIGSNNKIYQFACLGESPQDLSYKGEPTQLNIGSNNVFRESCTIHRGTVRGRGLTKIGDHNFFMAYTHVAHDCIVGSHTVFANNASLAGHVLVEDYVGLGGMVGVHQYCSVGAYSFAAGGALIFKDVPPYIMVSGYPAEAHGLNTVGLERRGFTADTIALLKKAYKIVFRQSVTLLAAQEELQTLSEGVPEIQHLMQFLTNSQRGIVR